jgi:2-polyprenyl-3-methyl-5-hydroxy-6-metoxy-1,4-benzoquinol methylase
MPLNIPDMSRRAQPAELPELMDGPNSREELRACLRDLARVNTWLRSYRPTFKWLDSYIDSFAYLRRPLRILDVGCGDGDGPRRIARWARKKRLEVRLTGLDLNTDTISIARESTPPEYGIEFVAANVFDYEPQQPVDVIVSSLFAHHLNDKEVVRFVGWMETHAQLGWFVNDLSRAATPYLLFKLLAKATRLHRLVQHDGPVSVARSFRADDWRRLCAAAGLANGDFGLLSYRPARLCVARRKQT